MMKKNSDSNEQVGEYKTNQLSEIARDIVDIIQKEPKQVQSVNEILNNSLLDGVADENVMLAVHNLLGNRQIEFTMDRRLRISSNGSHSSNGFHGQAD